MKWLKLMKLHHHFHLITKLLQLILPIQVQYHKNKIIYLDRRLHSYHQLQIHLVQNKQIQIVCSEMEQMWQILKQQVPLRTTKHPLAWVSAHSQHLMPMPTLKIQTMKVLASVDSAHLPMMGPQTRSTDKVHPSVISAIAEVIIMNSETQYLAVQEIQLNHGITMEANPALASTNKTLANKMIWHNKKAISPSKMHLAICQMKLNRQHPKLLPKRSPVSSRITQLQTPCKLILAWLSNN